MSKIGRIANSKKHFDGATLTERMKQYRTPAVSIAIVEHFKLTEARAFGVKNRATNEPTGTDTIFQAASISKPVFAVGVMRLFEHGVLDIDADVSEYVAGYQVPTYDNKKHKITLRHLLSHHAGLNLHGFAGYQQGQDIPTVEQILRGEPPSNHLKLKMFREAEAGFQYSGGGYTLAQKAVTDLCKRDFCELMDELICSPLDMKLSAYAQPLPESRLSEIAVGYNQYGLPLPGGCNTMPELAAAGLWTTPSDLARLGIEIMKAVRGESAYLSRRSAATLTTPAYEASPYAVGFNVKTCEKGPIFGHGGSNGGYRCNMVFCPQDGSGIALMQNCDIGAPICGEITSAFMEIFGWQSES